MMQTDELILPDVVYLVALSRLPWYRDATGQCSLSVRGIRSCFVSALVLGELMLAAKSLACTRIPQAE